MDTENTLLTVEMEMSRIGSTYRPLGSACTADKESWIVSVAGQSALLK